MSFGLYLTESDSTDGNKEVELKDFIEKVKKEGLYGYDIFKHITEDELIDKISDDNYFNNNMKKDTGSADKELSEMVIRPGTERNLRKAPEKNKVSLAVQLGLKKEEGKDSEGTDDSITSANNVMSNNNRSEVSKPTPQSFADRIKAEYEQRKKDQAERAARDQALRAEKAKQAEEARLSNTEKPVFSGSSSTPNDDKTEDSVNDKLDKQLTGGMFKRTRANTKSDEDGYKKVTNHSTVPDDKAESALDRAMKRKYGDESDGKEQRLGNSKQLVKRHTNNEYSKRTLLAVADRMKFVVYCKFRKADGQIRTGTFTIAGTESQITKKQDTIIVTDQQLEKRGENAWRTIPLDRIINISPV